MPGRSRRFSRRCTRRLPVDDDLVAFGELAVEDVFGDGVLDLALDEAAQRPGAEDGVVAFLGEMGLGGVGDLERDVAVGEALAQVGESGGRRSS